MKKLVKVAAAVAIVGVLGLFAFNSSEANNCTCVSETCQEYCGTDCDKACDTECKSACETVCKHS